MVAVHAVVNVPVHIRMAKVGRVIAAMALGALEDRVVIRVGMARRAHAVGVAVRNRELGVLRVVKRRWRPGSRRMAGVALR